jgi:hypothetical protein
MMNWKPYGSGRGLIVMHYPSIFLEELRNAMKNLSMSVNHSTPRFGQVLCPTK